MFNASKTRPAVRALMTGVALLTLASCGSGHVVSSSPATDAADMTPPLSLNGALAGEAGLKTDLYDSELKEAVMRLNGMKLKMNDIDDALKDSGIALQRVKAMRDELDALDARFKALQLRMVVEGGAVEGGVADEAGVSGLMPVPVAGEVVTQKTTVTTTTVPADADLTLLKVTGVGAKDAPQPLTDQMGVSVPDAAAPKAVAKPVVEAPKPVAKAEAPKAGTTKADETKPAPVAGKAGVQGVRVGTHDDTVRVVLDVNGATDFTTSLDGGEKILTVELPKTKWAAAETQAAPKNPLIASYTAQASGGGSVALFALKGDTKIVKTHTLKAAGGKPARIIIDLSK